MRILHVSDCFPPRLGGIETQVAHLIEQQKNRGHEIQVLTLTPGPQVTAVRRLQPHIEKIALIRFGCTADVEKMYDEFQPELIHAHVGSGAWLGWAAVKFAQRKKIPLVLSVHSIWGSVARFFYTGRLRRSTRTQIIPVSRQAQLSIGNPDDSKVIANGLEMNNHLDHIPKRPELTFITASRLVPRKRLIELIEIFANLQSKFPASRVHLRIAGDGPMMSKLVKKIQKSNLTNVHLLGRLTRHDLHNEYAQSHAYIQLSKLEAFGLAAAEAQVHKLGVIGLKASGISDFVQHQVDGYLGQDDKDIETFLETVIAEPEILTGFSNNVEVQKKPYQWNSVLEAYESVYQQCVGEV